MLIAMSGGVDSSVAAYLLRSAGFDPAGVTFLMYSEAGAAADAAQVCRALSIPHRVVDARGAFAAAVIADFMAEYAAGRTPNPCIMCNREIKFPYLIREADRMGEDCPVASGHYARVVRCGSRYAIARGADTAKDQSYMLWQLPQETLARLHLPLGEYTKTQIRQIARENALPSADAGDSQDICFIPGGDYAAFLRRSGMALPPGEFTDEGGAVLGVSENQACYTVGQRRGLGIALGCPMYVCGRDAVRNRVTLTPRDPHSRHIEADGVRYMAAAPGDLDAPRRLTAKFRYARGETPVTAQVCDGVLRVMADGEVRAPAPGQSVVLYDGDTVVAGGVIRSASVGNK